MADRWGWSLSPPLFKKILAKRRFSWLKRQITVQEADGVRRLAAVLSDVDARNRRVKNDDPQKFKKAVHLRDDAKGLPWLAEHGLQNGKFICVIPRLRYTPYYKIRNTARTKDDTPPLDAQYAPSRGRCTAEASDETTSAASEIDTLWCAS